jgi:hypothetical protein
MREGIQALLEGAVETHVHGAPDVIPRKRSDDELAQEASKARMKGLVLKCHHALTSDRASLLRRWLPGLEIFGGVVLNNASTGGFNPLAVEGALRLGSKIIWMPTLSAQNAKIAKARIEGKPLLAEPFDPALSVLGERGRILPEVHTILELIARSGAILATGHLSAGESRTLIQAAIGKGVKRILVNHPESRLIRMTIDEQKELRREGVYFERCYVSHLLGVPFEAITDGIRQVGVETTILATDLGQVGNPSPVEGLESYLERLHESGISVKDLGRMVKTNPAEILDLR